MRTPRSPWMSELVFCGRQRRPRQDVGGRRLRVSKAQPKGSARPREPPRDFPPRGPRRYDDYDDRRPPPRRYDDYPERQPRRDDYEYYDRRDRRPYDAPPRRGGGGGYDAPRGRYDDYDGAGGPPRREPYEDRGPPPPRRGYYDDYDASRAPPGGPPPRRDDYDYDHHAEAPPRPY